MAATRLLNVYVTTDEPLSVMSRVEWVKAFRDLGFVDDGKAFSDRPRDALVLWRGAAVGDESGLSWSPSSEVARFFAKHREGGRLWCAYVEPQRLLARVAAGDGDVVPEVVDEWFVEVDDSVFMQCIDG